MTPTLTCGLTRLERCPQGVSILQEAIQKPFEARHHGGRRRLMALLQGCMVCASKAKLEAAGLLPTCKKQV